MNLRLAAFLALAGFATASFADRPSSTTWAAKLDKVVQRAAYSGRRDWKKANGGKPHPRFRDRQRDAKAQAMRRMAEKNANPIVAVNSLMASRWRKVLKDFLKQQFAIIDMVVKAPKRRASVVFKEQKAASWSYDGRHRQQERQGFIGGMDIPPIRKFQCGYEQGAKYANPLRPKSP